MTGTSCKDNARVKVPSFQKVTCFSTIQEVFHVYLNKFESAVSHSFLIIFSDNKFLYRLIRSPEMRSHQENIS